MHNSEATDGFLSVRGVRSGGGKGDHHPENIVPLEILAMFRQEQKRIRGICQDETQSAIFHF